MPAELLVIIPTFNEERSVASVLDGWMAELERSGADYSILLIDDGSTDATSEVLKSWKRQHSSARIEVMRYPNRGHGQTCLEGYLIAWDRGGSEPGVCGRRSGQALTNF